MDFGVLAPRWVWKSSERMKFSGTVTIQAAKLWILAAMSFWFYLPSLKLDTRDSSNVQREQFLVWTIQICMGHILWNIEVAKIDSESSPH